MCHFYVTEKHNLQYCHPRGEIFYDLQWLLLNIH
jgi:hypothetical protein